MRTLIFLLLTTCISAQYTYASLFRTNRCTTIFAPKSKGWLKAHPIFDNLDFTSKKPRSYGISKMSNVFTDQEVSKIIKLLPKHNRLGQFGTIDFSHFNTLYYIKVRRLLGKSIANKLFQFVKEFDSEIKKRSDDSYFIRVYLRAGKNMVNITGNGHVHFANSITLTKSESGEGSWIKPEGPYGEAYQATSNEVVLFTRQLHGSGEVNNERVLIIVEAIYKNPIIHYLGDKLYN